MSFMMTKQAPPYEIRNFFFPRVKSSTNVYRTILPSSAFQTLFTPFYKQHIFGIMRLQPAHQIKAQKKLLRGRTKGQKRKKIVNIFSITHLPSNKNDNPRIKAFPLKNIFDLLFDSCPCLQKRLKRRCLYSNFQIPQKPQD